MHIEHIKVFQELTKTPTQFLQKSENFCDQIKENLKLFYDFSKNEEIKTLDVNVLNELMIRNFDLEQIWQQIELQNNSVIKSCLSAVSKLAVDKSGLLFKKQAIYVPEENDDQSVDSEREDSRSEEGNLEEVESSEDNDEDQIMESGNGKNIKSSVVDDDFFKLAEMEKFLKAEEEKLNDPDSGNDSDDHSESEGSVDMFKHDPADEDDDDDVRCAKYKDFFVTRADPQKDFPRADEVDEQPHSSFELRQRRINEKIEEMEVEAVQEKSWQLKGEITAENRPQNSLLEEIVEFDLTSKPAPVITEQTTMQLEDIIKQRIKHKTFDSVERKVKPTETLFEYKKKLVLDQEKNKDSLAQIYEKEFLQQQAAVTGEEKEEKEPELHREINSMMQSLFVKLDALSNFHFTPKPAIPELTVVSNIPAINAEEVAPVAISDATLLAPEEIQRKSKGDAVGKNERTVTDKKRERRKKKLKQKTHVKAKKDETTVSDGRIKKQSKFGKNVEKVDNLNGNRGPKSSKAFFTQLEEEVKSQIKRKSSNQHDKERGNVLNAKRLKF